MAKLFIIQGFIGAGKSTYSSKLAKETGAVHFNPDKFVAEIFSKNEYMNDWDRCFDKAVARLWEKTKECLRQGIDVIFDMGFWLKKDRDFARAVAKECDAQCEHIFLYVPDEILKQRIVADRPPEWAKRHLENFEKNKKKFEMPTADENATIINNF